LTGSVVENLELLDHLSGVLGGIVHGVTTSGLLAGVTFSESPVDGVGQGELAEGSELLIINLELGELLRSEKSLLRIGWDNVWFVRDGSLERVEDNLNVVVLGWQLLDLVGNSLGLGEGWDILSDTSEGENHVLWVGSAQLSLALLTENSELSIWLLVEDTSGLLGQLGVDTTAETLVGGSNDDEGLASWERLGLGLLEDGVGGLTVDLRVGHGTLGTGELGGGDNLHGVGDLFDVTNGLETAFDFTEGSIIVGEEWLCR
jgi:hypothetical protein